MCGQCNDPPPENRDYDVPGLNTTEDEDDDDNSSSSRIGRVKRETATESDDEAAAEATKCMKIDIR